ncbi:NACHT domain-containing protein [Rhizobium brockwellii]|uniref:NACHT domain-containing protein n=2 Tax=Rhizobium TaxID=379 RepID=UPI003F958064
MDQRLVTEVFVSKTGQRGSGYVVGPGLILTAYHVVSEENDATVQSVSCLVRPQGDWEDVNYDRFSRHGYTSARLIWPKPGGPAPRFDATRRVGDTTDVALLRVSKPVSDLIRTAPSARFNIGPMMDHFDCRLAGFPLLSTLRLPDRRRFRDLSEEERAAALLSANYMPDMTDLAGHIAPGSLQRSSYYLISGTTDQPLQRELWQGLSGAAVFDGDGYIVGVVTDNVTIGANDGVVAERMSNPATDSGFRQLLGIDVSRDGLKRDTRLFIRDNQKIAAEVAARSRRATNDSLLTPLLGPDVGLDLVEVFVRPEFWRRATHQSVTDPTSPARPTLSIHEVLESHPTVLIIGDPGSGKSMAAADLALGLSAPWSKGELGQYFPLLLMAKDLEHNPNKLAPGHLLSSAFADAIESSHPTLPETFLTDARRADVPVVLIVDGLDEIIGDANVAAFLKRMGGAAAHFGQDVRLVLFSRPLGLDHIHAALKPFAVHSLLPFNAERSAALAEKIFLCWGREKTDARRWHREVQSMPLASLVDTPALLTMMAVTALGSAKAIHAETRSDVIRLFIETLLTQFDVRTWPEFADFVKATLYGDREAFGANFRNEKARMQLLVTIGFAATEARNLDASFFHQVFREFRRSKDADAYSTMDETDYENVMRQFLLASGLLAGERSRFRFCHNLIREYFASVRLEEAVADAAENWLLRWRAPLWREAILMALPGWLRLAKNPEPILLRLITIGNTSYDGALFCGAALLERLPISQENEDLLFRLTLAAIERWNECENLLVAEGNANPSALIKRLIAQDRLRTAMVEYFRARQDNVRCPLSSSELVRLLSDLGEPMIVDTLCENGSSFIAGEAVAALFDMGKEELAERRALELLNSSRATPKVAYRLLSYLSGIGRSNLLKEIAATPTIATPVGLAAAAEWFVAGQGTDAAAALRASFYGTALGDEPAGIVIDALTASGVAWRKANIKDVSPKTLQNVLISCISTIAKRAVENLDNGSPKRQTDTSGKVGGSSRRRRQADELRIASARKTLVDLYSVPASGVSMVSIASSVAPLLGSRDVLAALADEYRTHRGSIPHARAMAEQGDFTALEEIAEQGHENDRQFAAKEVARLRNAPQEPSAPGVDADFSEILWKMASDYSETDDGLHLQKMFDAERAAAKYDDRIVAGRIIRSVLLENNQVDLLRSRLADENLPIETRKGALTALAKLGDVESVNGVADASELRALFIDELIESFETIGRSEALPSLRRAAVLDPSVVERRRLGCLTALLVEDPTGTRDIAERLVAGDDTPRSLRLEAACLLASSSQTVFPPLVDIAKEEPSEWAAILAKLCEREPVSRALALAVLIATSGAQPSHFHGTPALLAGEPSEHDLPLLLELVNRIDHGCHGSSQTFGLLAERLETAALDDPQRIQLRQAVLATIAVDGAIGAPSAALALARIDGAADWIETIGTASLASPTLFEQLRTGLLISDEFLTGICEIVAKATLVEPRVSAALAFLRLGKAEKALPILQGILVNATEARILLFNPEFLTLIEDGGMAEVGVNEQLASLIGWAFCVHTFAEPVPFESFYRAGMIALRRIRPRGRRDVEIHLDDLTGSTGARLRLVWKLALAQSRRDIKACLRIGKELVLDLPGETWLRDLVLTASRDSGDLHSIRRCLADEMSFFQATDPARAERCRAELQALH